MERDRINKLTAEKVMGWHEEIRKVEIGKGLFDDFTYWVDEKGEIVMLFSDWNPYEDERQALKVVGILSEDYDFVMGFRMREWYVSFLIKGSLEQVSGAYGNKPTAAMMLATGKLIEKE